jgi:hypothetical protein
MSESNARLLEDVLGAWASTLATGELVRAGRAGGEDGADAVRGLIRAGRAASARVLTLELALREVASKENRERLELEATRDRANRLERDLAAAQATIRSLTGPDAAAAYDRLDLPASGEGWTAAVVGRGTWSGTILELRGIPDGHVHVVRDTEPDGMFSVECVTCTAASGTECGCLAETVSGAECRRRAAQDATG